MHHGKFSLGLTLLALISLWGCGGHSKKSAIDSRSPLSGSANPSLPPSDLCDNGDCRKRNAALREVLNLQPGQWLYANSNYADLDDHWGIVELNFEREDSLTGTFRLDGKLFMAPEKPRFTSGTVSLEQGYLVLRSEDRQHTAFFFYDRVQSGSRSVGIFSGHFPGVSTGVDSRVFVLNLYRF